MSTLRTSLYFVVILCFVGMEAQGTCPLFGHNISQTHSVPFCEDYDEESSSSSEDCDEVPIIAGLLLDLDNPTMCRGVGVAWHYCFYRTSSTMPQVAYFAVYRKENGNATYTQVEGTQERVEVQSGQYNTDFVCDTVSLREPAHVVEGDILGACILDDIQSGSTALDIVARDSALTLYRKDGSELCTGLEMANTNETLSMTAGLSLHLYLETDPLNETSNDSPMESTHIILSATVASAPFESTHLLLSSAATATTTLRSGFSYQAQTPVTTSTNLLLLPSFPYPTSSPSDVGADNNSSFSSQQRLSLPLLLGIAIGSGGVAVVCPICLIIAIRCMIKRKKRHSFTVTEEEEVCSNAHTHLPIVQNLLWESESEEPYNEPSVCEEELLQQIDGQLNVIPRETLTITVPIGQGQFSIVNRGIWHDSTGMIYEVAVKSLAPGSPEEEQIKFLQEAAIMGQFSHPNVLQLYGVVVVHDCQLGMLVMELARGGDLRNYLKSMKQNPEYHSTSNLHKQLLKFSKDVAMGMLYLSKKGFIHRDLAAHNILLTAAKICKIRDFGRSRNLENEYYISHGGGMPLRWTAPEAVTYQKFSTASDVWSYGCLLYEIWSTGTLPFEDCNKDSEILGKLTTGYRHPSPLGCPTLIYEVMTMCWHPDPHSRPGFRDITISLLHYEDSLLSQSTSNTQLYTGVDSDEFVDEIYTDNGDIEEIYDTFV